jgi:hypothetical protein
MHGFWVNAVIDLLLLVDCHSTNITVRTQRRVKHCYDN